MKSPFPGMDPYLEARWPDVHATLIALLKESLQSMLPAGLRARSEERIILEEEGKEPAHNYRSDIAVVDLGRRESPSVSPSATLTAEPFVVDFFDGPQLDRFVQIIDVNNGQRVITAIEILSPWNKSPGRLNNDYQRKIENYSLAGVSLVEIDLLRSPRGRLKVSESDLPPERRSPYFVCLQRSWRPQRWEVYSLSLRNPLPAIPIPLRQTDAEITLPLQPLMDRVYAAGGHDDIDYTKPPVPPLSSADAVWAEEWLSHARRNGPQ